MVEEPPPQPVARVEVDLGEARALRDFARDLVWPADFDRWFWHPLHEQILLLGAHVFGDLVCGAQLLAVSPDATTFDVDKQFIGRHRDELVNPLQSRLSDEL